MKARLGLNALLERVKQEQLGAGPSPVPTGPEESAELLRCLQEWAEALVKEHAPVTLETTESLTLNARPEHLVEARLSTTWGIIINKHKKLLAQWGERPLQGHFD